MREKEFGYQLTSVVGLLLRFSASKISVEVQPLGAMHFALV
jgi:hypothetical protein